MFLKTLTIKGFKSFADATTIDLEPGVAVIVGPNGSGKSNVVDAIAWVLGAQAPSSVRSSKMDDVIFAGTQGRAALGRAEVGLTIDNSAGILPIEFGEVTISRTLFRTGESEYAINGVPCRLLDIQDLLSDSGVGRQQHVIVSQGQIDAVLNARPEDRRLIIEEAAGILKFRRRKEKAERRLVATQENLVRLQDLLREVRRQLRPLERQADAARRHGSVVGELNALRIHVAGREIDGLRTRLRTVGDERRELGRQRTELEAELDRLDRDVLGTEAQLASSGDDELGDALVQFESLREKARGQVAVLVERQRGLARERDAAVDQDVVASLESESAQVAAELTEVDRDLADLEPRRAELDERHRALVAERERFESEVPEDLVPRQAAFAFDAGPEAEAPTPVVEAELVGAVDAARQQRERAETAAAGADGRRRAAEAEHARWSAREEALAMALDEARSRAGADRLAAVDGVLGTLLDLVEVDAGWEQRFEAAIGEVIAAVVVDGTDSGRSAVDALHQHDLPGLVLAAGARSAPRPTPPVGEPVRHHVRATRPDVEALLDSLLAGAVAVEGGWSQAIDVARLHPDAVVVTVDGDRFGPGGWRIGLASGQATAAALDEARRHTATAVEAIHGADRQVASAQLALEQATRAEADAERALRQAAGAVSRHLQQRTESLEADRAELDRRQAALAERREVLAGRHAEIERRLAERADERASAQEQRLQLERRGVAVERLARFVSGRLEQIGTVLDGLREERRRQSEATKAVTERLAGLRAERAGCEKRLAEVRELAQRREIDEAETRLRLETAVESLRSELDIEPDDAVAAECPPLEGITPKARIRELERELRLMGPINPLALQEFEALQERHQFLQDQLDDVKATRRDLSKVIREIDHEIVNVFSAAFADVSSNFEKLFETLFPGGRGRLKLTDPENLLETGIEVEARPSGKNVRKLSLLSGGERSLTALAYLFAVFRSRPSPFYVMDEVEAALDDVNLHRFLDLVHEFRAEAQLLIVSHQKRTMEAADCLYGVTMKPGGSSRVVSEKVESVSGAA